MKVLLINNCHYKRGGADVVYLNTAELLESKGHSVYFFSVKSKENIKNNFETYFVNFPDFKTDNFLKKLLLFFRFFYSFESVIKLEKLLKKYKPDIAHIHLYKGGLTSSILGVLKKMKVPVIISLHDYGLIDPHNLLLDGNLNISEKTINGSAFNCFIQKSNNNSYFLSLVSTLEYLFHFYRFPYDEYFDTILAVSKFSKNKHLESRKFNWKINHLYNFTPILDTNFTRKKSTSKYFLFFGRLSKEKGIKTLIDSFCLIDQKIKLKIVGTGSLYSELKELIYDRGLQNIELIGYKKGSELYNIISNARFVVVPSEWYENNPMSIIESYALGVPVIGSCIGGIPEIIVEGKTGFTYEMGNIDDLVLALNKGNNLTDEEYLKFKMNARNFAEEHFSPDNHYNELIKLYSKTITKKTSNDNQK